MTRQELEKEFDAFFQMFNGMSVEVVDSGALNQCVDLAVAFADWLDLPRQTNAQYYAYQIYTNTPAYVLTYMDKIPNTPEFVPQKGDFIVWDKAVNGTAGHIGIANGVGNVNGFQSFDQNWSAVQRVSQIINHTYDHVLGVLRVKVTNSGTTPIPPMNDKRPYWFDLLSKTEFGATGWEKLTDAQINKWVSELPDRKVAGGKWDVLCDKAGMPHTSTPEAVIAKLSASAFDKNKFLEGVKKLLFG